ncbi:MAG TPA: hypothetical protein VG650_18820 [Mycobacteriales bacterium]|nr:hypothetical protein [Mycobacteriales bacterium]
MRRLLGGVALVVAAAGCASGSSGGSAAPQPTVTVTRTVGAANSATPSPTPTSGASNLFLTAAIRQQLVDAKADEAHLRHSAFVGLYKGSAFYARDNSTGIYWAAASVVPSGSSVKAQVYSQDEGGYNIFELQPNGTWSVYDAGRDGPEARTGAQCPVKIPADVLQVWHWAPNTCDPPISE